MTGCGTKSAAGLLICFMINYSLCLSPFISGVRYFHVIIEVY